MEKRGLGSCAGVIPEGVEWNKETTYETDARDVGFTGLNSISASIPSNT